MLFGMLVYENGKQLQFPLQVMTTWRLPIFVFHSVGICQVSHADPFESAPDSSRGSAKEIEQRESWCALTILYVCLEVSRSCEDKTERLALRTEFCEWPSNCLLRSRR
jgi:hypothetical protein